VFEVNLRVAGDLSGMNEDRAGDRLFDEGCRPLGRRAIGKCSDVRSRLADLDGE
jgi:hypothetical protein